MLATDERANLSIRILWIADAQAVSAFCKAFNKLRIDALLNENA